MYVLLRQLNLIAKVFLTVVGKSHLYGARGHCRGLILPGLLESVWHWRCDAGQRSEINRVAVTEPGQTSASDSILVAAVAARSRYQV